MPGRKFYVEILSGLTSQQRQDGGIIRKHNESSTILKEALWKIEISLAMKIGQKPAEMSITFLIPRKEYSPVFTGDRFGTNDRSKPMCSGCFQEMRYSVEPISISECEFFHPHDTGCRTDIC
jgi:hypothetical protein